MNHASKQFFAVSTLILAGQAPAQELQTYIAESLPAVVSISAETPDGTMSGSGFIVDSSGDVVTNLHVIQAASTISIRLRSGEVFEQIVVAASDEARDMALLRFPGSGLPELPLGNSRNAAIGDSVYAIGNPLEPEETVVTGIVTNVGLNNDGTRILQTNIAASQASSGGPLFHDVGGVIGIITSQLTEGGNLVVAVPDNYLRRLRALAEPKEWMKKDNPEELRAILGLSGQSTSRCPSRHQRYQSVVNAVLIRSGIQPASEETELDPPFYLLVELICQDLAPQPTYAFTVTTHFGKVVGEEAMLFADKQRTAKGVGSDDAIVNAIRNITEEAITEYLRANFGL